MDPKHLWKLERAYDGLNVTLVTLVRIAEAFEVPVQSLFAYRGEVRPVSRKKKGARPRTRDTFTFQDAPQLEERYTRCVPLFELEEVAASIGQVCELRAKTWIAPDEELLDTVTLGRGCFASRLTGLPSGHPLAGRYALFQSPARELSGGPLLVTHPSWSTPTFRLAYYRPQAIVGASGLLENGGASLRSIGTPDADLELEPGVLRQLHFVASLSWLLVSNPPPLTELT